MERHRSTAGLADPLPVVFGMRPDVDEAVWKRSEISAATGWIKKFHLLIPGLPVGIPNKTGKKARLGLHGCL